MVGRDSGVQGTQRLRKSYSDTRCGTTIAQPVALAAGGPTPDERAGHPVGLLQVELLRERTRRNLRPPGSGAGGCVRRGNVTLHSGSVSKWRCYSPGSHTCMGKTGVQGELHVQGGDGGLPPLGRARRRWSWRSSRRTGPGLAAALGPAAAPASAPGPSVMPPASATRRVQALRECAGPGQGGEVAPPWPLRIIRRAQR